MTWQPIETAPKDGTRFVAFGTIRGEYGYTEDETKEVFAKWSKSYQRFCVDQPMGRYSSSVKFTHWMPLPEPPVDSAQAA